jgi:hypothetical protein
VVLSPLTSLLLLEVGVVVVGQGAVVVQEVIVPRLEQRVVVDQQNRK